MPLPVGAPVISGAVRVTRHDAVAVCGSGAAGLQQVYEVLTAEARNEGGRSAAGRKRTWLPSPDVPSTATGELPILALRVSQCAPGDSAAQRAVPWLTRGWLQVRIEARGARSRPRRHLHAARAAAARAQRRALAARQQRGATACVPVAAALAAAAARTSPRPQARPQTVGQPAEGPRGAVGALSGCRGVHTGCSAASACCPAVAARCGGRRGRALGRLRARGDGAGSGGGASAARGVCLGCSAAGCTRCRRCCAGGGALLASCCARCEHRLSLIHI